MSACRYETTVVAVGPLVDELLAGGRLILFGEQAPAELHEICALHRPGDVAGEVQVGDAVTIGDARLAVAAVGDLANPNLASLGHVTLRTEPDAQSPLPGEIVVEGRLPGSVSPGTTIQIEGPS